MINYIEDDSIVQVPKSLMKDKSLSAGERFFYIVLCFEAKKTNTLDWEFLCFVTGRTYSTLRKYLHHLIIAGWVGYSDKEGYKVYAEKQNREG